MVDTPPFPEERVIVMAQREGQEIGFFVIQAEAETMKPGLEEEGWSVRIRHEADLLTLPSGGPGGDPERLEGDSRSTGTAVFIPDVGWGFRMETNPQVEALLDALPSLSVDDCEYLARLHRLARHPAESGLLANDVAMRLERAADLMALRVQVDAAFPTGGAESTRHAARDVARSAAAALLFRDDITAPEFNALYQPFDDFWAERRPDDPSPLAR